MATEYMTATEAIGWVATRDEAFASSLTEVTANRLALLLAFRKDLVRKPRAAANVLVQRCAAGRIVAQGRKGNARVATSDRRERVVEAEWPGLSLINLRLGRATGDGVQFHDVVFRRKDVLDCFPPIPDPVATLKPEDAPTVEHGMTSADPLGEHTGDEASTLAKQKGSEADARRAWELELSEVQAGVRRQRSQKKLEAEYPAIFHVSRQTIRSWIVGTRGLGRPPSGGA